jgi:hypothetical protein
MNDERCSVRPDVSRYTEIDPVVKSELEALRSIVQDAEK